MTNSPNAAAHFMDEQLFNGEYYQQKVQYLGLRRHVIRHLGGAASMNTAAKCRNC